jgi:hypothetical protein
VANRQSLWQLDEVARRYGARPSAFLGLAPDSWEAYQLDLAAWMVGAWVEGKLAERDKRGKPVHRLRDLLSDEPAKGTGFRAMGMAGARRMAIPESGVW